MNIQKTRNVKTPSRGTNLSAGLDFYVPEDFQETTIHTGESVLIPSGNFFNNWLSIIFYFNVANLLSYLKIKNK